MHKDLFKKIISKPGRYFPTITLFWVLNKTNDLVDLLILLLAFIFLIYSDKLILYFMLKIDRKKVESLLKQKKESEALDSILEKVRPKSFSDFLLYIAMFIVNIIFILYSYYRLIPLWDHHISKFFIIVGFVAFLKGIIKFLYHFFRHFKVIVRESFPQFFK